MKTHLLIDNRNETELINKSFMCANKILFFKLEKPINLILGNNKVVQKLTIKSSCRRNHWRLYGTAGLLFSKIKCVYNYLRQRVAADAQPGD